MIKVVTVCGNGIGSSLMLKLKLEEIAKENQIEIDAESIDSNAAKRESRGFICNSQRVCRCF